MTGEGERSAGGDGRLGREDRREKDPPGYPSPDPGPVTVGPLAESPAPASPAARRVKGWLLPLDRPPLGAQDCFKGAGLVLTEAWCSPPAPQ